MDTEPETQPSLHRSLTLENEFRLVILLPSRDFGSRIECRLEHAVIGSCKPYEALSYVWGEPEFTRCILLNGSEFFITRSLENALRHLRQAEEERMLWVDAICINQKDIAERREQVGYMRQIYSHCACDVLWLDTHDNECLQDKFMRAFELIRKLQGYKLDDIETIGWESRPNVDTSLLYLAKRHDSVKVGDMVHVIVYPRRGTHWSGGEKGPFKVLEQTSTDTFRLELPDYMDRYGVRPILSTAVAGLATQTEGEPPKQWLLDWSDKDAIQRLLRDDAVWKRVWIKQEVACAPRVLLTCSCGTLDWALVESLMDGGRYYTDAFHMVFSHNVPASWTDMFGAAKSIKDQREKVAAMNNGDESTVLDVLSRFKDAVSTDPRDKIYGLLGLMSDTLGIEADYSRSVAETFTSVAVTVINSSATLDIICQSSWCRAEMPAKLPVENLPSWVPDFHNSQQGEFLFAQRDIYMPARLTCTVPCIVGASGTLSLNGFRVGRLTSPNWFARDSRLQPPWRILSSDCLPLYQVLRAWIEENLNWQTRDSNKRTLYRTGENPVQALWRTLAADTKGYPTVRLTADDVMHDHAIFQENIDNVEHPRDSSQMRSFTIWHKLIGNGWQFHIAEKELFVLAQLGAREGDLVVILDGGKTPMVVRELCKDESGNELYQVVGGAYVHGLMDGEVLRPENGFEEQTIRLI